MSFPSEGVRRRIAAGLFVLAMAASALVYRGITPLGGFPAVSTDLSRPVDRAVARLSGGVRPFEQVTTCMSLRAYLVDRVLPAVTEALAAAPPRPVILCLDGAPDAPAAASRALRDGLAWVRGIDGLRVIAYARDEASFNRAMAQAGVSIPPGALRPLSPQLSALHSNAPGVRQGVGGWRVPAHADDGLMLFGPYLDLAPGPYRVRLHVALDGAPDRCRAVATAFHPTLGITRDAGSGAVRAAKPVAVARDPGDPCSLTLTDDFALTLPTHQVETPFRAASALPYLIDAYALGPAAAQAR